MKTTRAPSAASRVTIASPMPEVPPVTRARWSEWPGIGAIQSAGERQVLRQPEAREQRRRHEAADRGDAPAAQVEHVEHLEHVALPLRLSA